MIKSDKSGAAPAPEQEEKIPTEAQEAAPEQGCEELAAQVAELRERALRQAAELENYKKRTDREKAEFFKRANEGLVKELLPVMDNLERALAAAKENPQSDQTLLQGVEMVHAELLKTLSRHGLEPVEAMGQLFDPELHEAMMQQEDPEQEENIVLAEAQKGYTFEGRLLRPAMVVVSRKPS
ncbi:MAG: nucleotide exchange factor GrpE [Proteobacteria bacterium]|nr:nucleotide exchange factor GrpE [Pseudomonadota bacterium]MBU4383738.1 nucleotide exchange factor GrpE [Pseudomonadota bacterium]MBU4604732.1 nucleotide exchange factor GrpE [Pseudomonadota bacterium]MCG2763960.1 nucleotide exchange factor GrpE [Desulfarculaceae bacterium]